MMKWLLRVIAGVAAVLVVAGVVGMLIIDGVTRSAIESNASRALDVRTSIEGADVNLSGGQVDLHGLEIANPEGFEETQRFLRLDHGRADLSFSDLFRRSVEIERMTLDGIEVNLERRGLSSNYGTILENLKAFQDRDEPGRGTKFVVREVVLRNITVTVNVLPVGGEATRTDLDISEIVLQDVGAGKDGVSTAEIVGVVTMSVLAAVLHQGTDVLPEAIVDGLGQGLGAFGDLGGFGITIAGEAFTGIGELLGSVIEGLENVGDVFLGDEDEE